jgi:hypothetical protein
MRQVSEKFTTGSIEKRENGERRKGDGRNPTAEGTENTEKKRGEA